jgi:glycosyltransferase involved in cell wall biosynthesis
VIIPTHNRRVLLARTLHSVLNQQDVDLAVVVVDDGGSDGTEAAVAGLKNPRVSVVRHPSPRGVSSARNSGIARAETPWLAFVDDDDLWAPTKLRSQLDALRDEPAAGWSCAGAVQIDGRCRVSGWQAPPTTPEVADQLLSQNVVPGGGSGVVASRELTLSVGGFDEALSNLADWDFYVRLALQSPLAAVDRPHVGYFIHVQGMAHDVDRSAREYRYLDVKYGAERHARDVALNDQTWLSYLAVLAYSGGRRWSGTRMHAELMLRHGQWRSLLSVGKGLAPLRVRQAHDRGREIVLPQDWGQEATTWLAPYASGWLDEATTRGGGRYDFAHP